MSEFKFEVGDYAKILGWNDNFNGMICQVIKLPPNKYPTIKIVGSGVEMVSVVFPFERVPNINVQVTKLQLYGPAILIRDYSVTNMEELKNYYEVEFTEARWGCKRITIHRNFVKLGENENKPLKPFGDCICSISNLMISGCTCGFLEKEKSK